MMKKKLVTLLVSAILAISLTACSTNTTSKDIEVKSLVDKMVTEGYVVMPMAVDDAMAKDIYHLNLDDVEEYAIAKTGRSPGLGLIIVVQAKEGKVDSVKASIEKVLEDEIGKAFYPAEKEIAENAKVEVNGNYVSLFILNEEVSADAIKMYNEAIK